jgi:hypothetical protein
MTNNTPPRADVDIFASTLFDVMDMVDSEKQNSVIMGDHQFNSIY